MKIIQAVFVFLLLLNFCSLNTLAQRKDDNKLIGSFIKGDYSESAYHIASKILDLSSDGYENFLTKICSAKEVPFAIANSAGRPFELIKLLQRFKVDIRKVYFAADASCSNPGLNPKPVEYWAVKNSKQLKFERMLRADEIEVNYYFSEDSFTFEKNLKYFEKNVQGNKLNNHVVGYYLNKPSKELKANLRKTCNAMKRKFSNSIFQCYLSKWYEIVDEERKEPKFPALISIKLNKFLS